MVDVIDGSETVSTHGIVNWILLLVIFSVITVIGNWVGYKHPIADSLVGMLILSVITLAGLLLERYLPFNISSIIYISLIGIAVSLPMMPTSPFVVCLHQTESYICLIYRPVLPNGQNHSPDYSKYRLYRLP